ncbi:long-chain-fatty-acid--CoA ligase [Neobacillus sp. 114]|uniref:long-chain-fatty-acid--CoA ligase n=1 Tax=Neobacillus sp. 114 TaxID=3048535 RepID=UPI0024C3B993|nr:long-chain-fatty-acid--CoA ligase [Neobacillus sp. 114]
MEFTLGKLLSITAAKYSNKTAIIFGETRYTYAEVEERANRLANALMNMGLKKGDRCAVLFYNRAEWLEVHHGLAKAGIIVVPVNFRFTATEVKYVINNSRAKAIIYEESFSEIVEEIKEDTPSLAHYVGLGEEGKGINYDECLRSSSSDNPEVDVRENDPLLIGYTSGTTGFPKGAVITHRKLVTNHFVFSKEFGGINCTDKMLLIMPMFHGNSTWFVQMVALNGGTSVVFPSTGFNPEELLRIIETEKITFTSLVPTMLTMILNLPEKIKNKYDVSSLRMLLSSSAPIMSKTKEDTLKFFEGIDLYEFYGATEAGIVTLLRPVDQSRKARSVGQVVVGQEVRLLDESGNEVPVGEIGEIYVKGICVVLDEYWENPEATSEAHREDWLSIGDMARMDKEGYIYLGDRKKDLIISGGENVYPTEVENVIASHPKVYEVAVIGLYDELWGEKVHAVVELKSGEVVEEQEIIDYCRDKLAGYKIPKSVDFVEKLPKNPTGKIVRRTIKEQYSERTVNC